ncbi:MAG: aspartate-semialdehyde dehydrogenase [Leptospirales bacterium]
MSSLKKVAIAGASGAVGVEFVQVLETLDFPISELKLLASERSAGKEMSFRGETLVVEKMTPESFKGVDIALFSAGSSISKDYEKHLVDAGCIMIDNSSAFRMRDDVPLIIPEINPEDIQNHNGVLANPNCSTIIMLMAVYPIHKEFPVKRMVVSTYQAASGAGWAAMEELRVATEHHLRGEAFTPKVIPHPYAFNTFSHNSKVDESGYNEEERKMVRETHKILHDESIGIAPTCVRVPVFRAHSESINLQFKDEAPSVKKCRELISAFPGLELVDDPANNRFPMPIDASGAYDCLVGRIRKDISQPANGIELFVSGDQLLKGAALNAVQIAQLFV